MTTKEIPFLLGHCPSWPLHYEARTFLLGLLPAFFSGATILLGATTAASLERWPLLVSASPQWHNLSSAKCQRKAEIVEGTTTI